MKNVHIADLKKKYHLRDYKFGLVILVLIVAIIGVFMVGSAAPELMTRQLGGVIGGFVLMIIVSLLNYKWVLKFYWIMYAVNMVLLLATYFFGVTANQAQRWLAIGPENLRL